MTCTLLMTLALTLLLTTVLQVTTTHTSNVSFSLDIPRQAVREGGTITATCTVGSDRPGYFQDFPVYWERNTCRYGHLGLKRVILATNGRLAPQFEATGRYISSFKALDKEGTKREYHLTITGFRLRETGHYHCNYAAHPEINSRLVMWHPISPMSNMQNFSLQVSANNSVRDLMDGESLTVEEGSQHKFICLSVSNPAPEMQMFIGDGKGRVYSSLNQTYSYRDKARERAKCVAAPGGGQMFVYPVILTTTYYIKMDADWDGKPLVCKANIMQGSVTPIQTKTISVTLVVNPSPISKAATNLAFSFMQTVVIFALLLLHLKGCM